MCTKVCRTITEHNILSQTPPYWKGFKALRENKLGMRKPGYNQAPSNIFQKLEPASPAYIAAHSTNSSPRPLEELRPRGAPTTVPPPRPVNRRTAALFTDIEKFLCQEEERDKVRFY